MKVDHKDNPGTSVMVQLGNFWAKIKPKIFNFKNQVKFFGFLLILYCILTFTRTPVISPLETTSDKVEQLNLLSIVAPSDAVANAEVITVEKEKENEKGELKSGNVVVPNVPKVSFSEIVTTEAGKPSEIFIVPTHLTTPIHYPQFYKDGATTPIRNRPERPIPLSGTAQSVKSRDPETTREENNDKVQAGQTVNNSSHNTNSGGSDPNKGPNDNNDIISSAKILPDLEMANKEFARAQENVIRDSFENISDSTPSTTTTNEILEMSTLGTRTPQSLWTWICVSGESGDYCARTGQTLSDRISRVSQNVCWLSCGIHRTLWPYPSVKFNLGKNLTAFYPDDVRLKSYNVEGNNSTTIQMLKDAFKIVVHRIAKMLPIEDDQVLVQQPHKAYIQVRLNITSEDSNRLSLVTDESYSLSIKRAQKWTKLLTVAITAKSFFGLRHGLETFTQLMAVDTVNNCLQILNDVEIKDKPEYPYRGLLVDTGRNFIPIPALKRVIDGMSYNKLNMFHWHLTDSNSFPFYSKRVPQMSMYGAYSDIEIYMPNEVADLVQYARLRGVKIIPELDAPAHAGNGWQWGQDEGLGDLALCVNLEPWQIYCGQPPCGQLNPINPNVYNVLEKLYSDFLEVFDNDVFHMGGDEVVFQCWDSQDIKNWMAANNVTDSFSVWGYFQWEALRRLRKASSSPSISPIIWNSKLTSKNFNGEKGSPIDPADYIIQVWDADVQSISSLLKRGHPIIFSNANVLYMDWGSGSWLGRGHNQQYVNWQPMYDFNTQLMSAPYKESSSSVNNSFYGTLPQILGGEGALWSEKVDEDNLELKLWPRACAIAESLWSNPLRRGEEVYNRILIQSQRMRNRGLRVDRRQPKSCDQLTGHCSDIQSPF